MKMIIFEYDDTIFGLSIKVDIKFFSILDNFFAPEYVWEEFRMRDLLYDQIMCSKSLLVLPLIRQNIFNPQFIYSLFSSLKVHICFFKEAHQY